MKRVLISTGKAVSLREVSRTIGKVLQRNNIIPVLKTGFNPNYIRGGMVEGVIFFYPCDSIYALEYVGYYLILKTKLRDKLLFYTTVEGYPDPDIMRNRGFNYIEWVANSMFTAKNLTKVGLKVVDVVYHGIDFEEVKSAKVLGKKYYEKVHKDFKGKVVFSYVGANNVRKNLDGLKKAVEILNEKYKDKFVVLLITEFNDLSEFNIPNMYIVDKMGNRGHEQILAFMYACDFLVFPSVCEGFGLPVLEAMAMSRPCIHAWFEPLSEFSDPEANIIFPYEDIQEVHSKGGMIFTLHKYDPKLLAEAMERAIDIKLNHPSEYEDMSQKVYKKARKYDANKLYKYFVKRMK